MHPRPVSRSTPPVIVRPHHSLRILIIEDDEAVAELLADMLEELGHRVVAIHRTRADAEAAAATVGADLAILDINLGGKPSFPVADLLVARKIRVAFTTGYGILGLSGRYSDTPLLKKPFTTRSLAKLLSRFD